MMLFAVVLAALVACSVAQNCDPQKCTIPNCQCVGKTLPGNLDVSIYKLINFAACNKKNWTQNNENIHI